MYWYNILQEEKYLNSLQSGAGPIGAPCLSGHWWRVAWLDFCTFLSPVHRCNIFCFLYGDLVRPHSKPPGLDVTASCQRAALQFNIYAFGFNIYGDLVWPLSKPPGLDVTVSSALLFDLTFSKLNFSRMHHIICLDVMKYNDNHAISGIILYW